MSNSTASTLKIPAAYKDIVDLAAPELCFLEIGQALYAKHLGLSDNTSILWTMASVEETIEKDNGSFLPIGYLHIQYSIAQNDYYFTKYELPQEDSAKPGFLIAQRINTERQYAGISNSQFSQALAMLIEGKTIKLTSAKALNSLRVFSWRQGHRVTIDKLELTAKYAGEVDNSAKPANIFTIITDDGQEEPAPDIPSIGDLL